jgi:hypothetical protein
MCSAETGTGLKKYFQSGSSSSKIGGLLRRNLSVQGRQQHAAMLTSTLAMKAAEVNMLLLAAVSGCMTE